MQTIKVRPARGGLIIRFPENLARVLSNDGEVVNLDKFWQRRIEGGDVVIMDDPIVQPADLGNIRKFKSKQSSTGGTE
jgi:hypothetical protein